MSIPFVLVEEVEVWWLILKLVPILVKMGFERLDFGIVKLFTKTTRDVSAICNTWPYSMKSLVELENVSATYEKSRMGIIGHCFP